MEADRRVWRNISQTSAQRILVYSPDTDVYNIGLAIVQQCSSKEYIVQLNLPHSQHLKYLHLNNFVQALKDDPDLATLPRDSLLSIIHVLFICSGCYYISYFSGLVKAAFINVFCQHAAFITGDPSSGLLSQTKGEGKKQGYLALVRLIGTLYFKTHLSAFVSLRGVETPNQLFNSLLPTSLEDRHKLWFSDIRNIINDHIANEEERMPSYTALWRHWLRSCWVAEMWQHSPEEDLNVCATSFSGRQWVETR